MAIITVAGWNIAATFLTSFLLTFILSKYVFRKQTLPPNFGGIAVFISFWVGFFSLFPTLLFTSAQWRIFLASLIVLITGIIDDCFELKPLYKSLGILLAANIVYFMTDVQFSSVLLPNVTPWLFNLMGYILTIVWIYLMTNALNLLDGIDGLAGSVSITSLITLALMTYLSSLSIRLAFLMMLILLAVAILGFLPFNWNPAKIYLGDTGALFIGFMLGTLTVHNLKNVSFFSLIVPILFYAVPLFDTSYAIVRRFLNGQSVVEKDEDHVHHRLLRLGLTVPQVVYLMIGVTLAFSIFAILSQLYLHLRWFFIILSAGLVIILTIFMRRLDSK